MALLICIHGGSYSASYFNATPAYSVARTASALGLPTIAINRAGTGSSTPLAPPTNEGTDSAIQNQARWLHTLVLPALWREYGHPSKASSIVLLCHSVGATIGIATAALHATSHVEYPLSGLILSAFAHETRTLPAVDFTPGTEVDTNGNPTTLSWPQEALDETMLNVSSTIPPPPEILAVHTGMNGSVSVAETTDMSAPHLWQKYWRQKAKEVRVPVLCGVGDADAMIEGSEEVMREFTASFEMAARKEWTVMKGAPHAIELSRYSPAWYARCCGFALGCAVEAELRP